MAKVKYGEMISDLRGKINGTVHSKNRSGQYMRNKVTPVNPQTSYQQAARSALTALSQAWRSLSQASIAAWNTAVSNFMRSNIFGDQYKPTGKNLYTALNRNLALVGVSAITTPPTPGTVNAPSELSIVCDESANNLVITFTPSPVPANTAYIVEATPNYGPGENFVKNKFRNIGYIDAAATSPATITTTYTSRLGNMVAGKKVSVRLTPVNKTTGQRGTPLEASTIVVA